jgi:predicted Zn finger-like uncharacterized protein
MALITRCPSCATAFRVTPLHLQAHGGDVRCGRCAEVFNGFSSLATMQEPEVVDAPGMPIADKSDDTPEAASKKDPLPPALSDQEISFAAPSHKITQPDIVAETVTPEARNFVPSTEEESIPPISGPPPALENRVPDSHPFDVAQPRRISSPIWGFASLVLLVALAGQALYFYRAELSVIAPGAKPYLEQYCKLLGCTIPLLQNSELLNIESSEMQADTQYSGVITLTATVRNYAPYPQTFPLFELTLTDPEDRPLASRIFNPDTYLEKNSNPSSVIAPDYEFNVRLYLDSGNLNAAGYRLFLFYPAA